MNLVLGAGLAGLSSSWHLGHDSCRILERSDVIGGHARSVVEHGFTLDHGPHVSFTQHEYVRTLFAQNADGQYHEFPIKVANFFRGRVVDHPAQVHLWQLPEPLRTDSAIGMRAASLERERTAAPSMPPANYEEWLWRSFGRTFADNLPTAYTRKYWTVEPHQLSADWLGPRMHTPTLSEIDAALIPGSRSDAYYIKAGRYPTTGGYQRFFERFAKGATIRFRAEVAGLDLQQRRVMLASGETLPYERLISTLPLPEFVRLAVDVPRDVREAAERLDCTDLLLVDVFAPKVMDAAYRWFYVYDEDLLATRIHCVEGLAPANAPAGMTGVQVEVYASRYRSFSAPPAEISQRVARELVTLGFVAADDLAAGRVAISWRRCRYANVMFTHARRDALATIWQWLYAHGLEREPDDLDATTDWNRAGKRAVGTIVMAGRFAQWKYFWTDDCVLRGRQIAEAVNA